MADADLEEIRAKRLAELQARQRGSAGSQKNEEEKKREADDVKNVLLSQILDQSARARLNTLMVGKPEKGRLVENMLLSMAQAGQIMGKLGESELISILEKVNDQTQKSCKVKFDRRRAALDSDDDL